MESQLYSEMKMLVGSAIGGPFALAYYLARTLRTLGKPTFAVVLAIVFPLLLQTVAFTASFVPALAPIPEPFWYLVQFAILVGFTRGYVYPELKAYLAIPGPAYGWGNTLLIAVISNIATVILLLPFIIPYFMNSDPMVKDTFGKLKHEIYYDPGNITKPEVRRLAGALTETGFFDEEVQKGIEVSSDGKRYVITVFFAEDANKPEVIEPYRQLRNEIQKAYPVERIVIDMVSDSRENRIARLE